MYKKIRDEYENAVRKRDELKQDLQKMEQEEPKDRYNITITRDRLAYWEGKTEGLQFALSQINDTKESQ